MTSRVEWVTSERRLAQLYEPWNALAAAHPTPFAGPSWYAAWWRAFGDGLRLEVGALWHGDELRAVLPLTRRAGRLETMGNVETPTFGAPAADRAALA